MNINWYPNHDASRFRKKVNPKLRKPKLDTMLCPVCEGRKKRIDAKTKEVRQCVACKGEGRVRV